MVRIVSLTWDGKEKMKRGSPVRAPMIEGGALGCAEGTRPMSVREG
jgi:hypothetical protein